MNNQETSNPGNAGYPGVADIIAMLLRRWLLIGAIALAGLAGAVALSYLIAPEYTAKATLLPQSDSGGAGLLAAIGSFANLPLQGESNTEDLYGVIIKSDEILDRIIGRDWVFLGEQSTLHAVFGIDGEGERADRRLKSVLRSRVITFAKDKTNGSMDVRCHVPRDPDFAADLTNGLVDELGAFVERFKGQKSRRKLTYIEDRLAEVADRLDGFETDLARFKEENRSYLSSPELTRVAAGKERSVQAMTTVWIELTKQLEIAQIDVREDQYSIDVLDRAQPPLNKSKPKRSVLGLIGLVLAAAGACLFFSVRMVLVPAARGA